LYVRDKPQFRVTVTRSTGEAKLITATAVRFDDTMRARLVALGPEERESVMRDLAWLLSSHPVSFELNRDGTAPTSVLIAKPIYDDGLTKSSLMNAISELRRVATLVMLQLDKSMRTPPPNASSTPQQPLNNCPNCGSPVKVGAGFCSKCGAPVGRALGR
jgi:hypothetical protein